MIISHTRFFTFFWLLFFAGALGAQRNVDFSYPVNYISDFADVYVDNAGLGFVGGSCGVLRQTDNGGESWTTVDSPTNDDIVAIACHPSGCSTALLATDTEVYRLQNGSWTKVASGDFGAGGNLHWLSSAIVVHEAGRSSLRRSVDDGWTWTEIDYGGTKDSELAFVDGQTGYVFVEQKLLRTTDRGATFTETGYVHSDRVFYLTWLNENDGWFYDRSGIIHRSRDGGQSWMALQDDSPISSISALIALSETRLAAVQGLTRAESTDGGVSWERHGYGPSDIKSINGRYHQRGQEFFLTGSENQVLFSRGNFTDFVRQADFERTNGIEDIVFGSTTNGYAIAGPDMLRTTDAGANWELITLGIVARQIEVLPNGDPVILFDRRTLVSRNQGTDFTDLFVTGVVPDDEEYPDVMTTKPNGEVYLFSRNYAYASDDGGNSFTATRHGANLFANAIFFLDANNGYVVDRSRKFAFTTDGGRSWMPTGLFPGFSPTALYFTSVEEGWGTNGSRRYVTDNRGLTWSNPDDNAGGYSFAPHPIDGSILGTRNSDDGRNVFVRSKNEGESWSEFTGNCFFTEAGAVTPDGKYYFVAGGGFIVRHDLEEVISSTQPHDSRKAVTIKAFPNPAAELVNVAIPSTAETTTLTVYDGSGRPVIERAVSPGTTQMVVTLNGLPSGTYLLRWSTASGINGLVRVVKHR